MSTNPAAPASSTSHSTSSSSNVVSTSTGGASALAARLRVAVTPSTRRMRMSISTRSGRCRSTASSDLVAVAALGDDLEAVVGSEDAGHTGPHDRLVVDDRTDTCASHGAGGDAGGPRRATRRQWGRPRTDRRAPAPARPCRGDRTAPSRDPAVSPPCRGRRPRGARRRPRHRPRGSTWLSGAWRATLARASRATR